MVSLTAVDVFVKLRTLTSVLFAIFALMHGLGFLAYGRVPTECLLLTPAVDFRTPGRQQHTFGPPALPARRWDSRHAASVVDQLKTDRLGFIEHPCGAWTWSFSQQPLPGPVGLLSGGAVDVAGIVGVPFVRLRVALPEDLFPGVVAESLGRRAGMDPGLLSAGFKAEQALKRDLARRSQHLRSERRASQAAEQRKRLLFRGALRRTASLVLGVGEGGAEGRKSPKEAARWQGRRRSDLDSTEPGWRKSEGAAQEQQAEALAGRPPTRGELLLQEAAAAGAAAARSAGAATGAATLPQQAAAPVVAPLGPPRSPLRVVVARTGSGPGRGAARSSMPALLATQDAPAAQDASPLPSPASEMPQRVAFPHQSPPGTPGHASPPRSPMLIRARSPLLPSSRLGSRRPPSPSADSGGGGADAFSSASKLLWSDLAIAADDGGGHGAAALSPPGSRQRPRSMGGVGSAEGRPRRLRRSPPSPTSAAGEFKICPGKNGLHVLSPPKEEEAEPCSPVGLRPSAAGERDDTAQGRLGRGPPRMRREDSAAARKKKGPAKSAAAGPVSEAMEGAARILPEPGAPAGSAAAWAPTPQQRRPTPPPSPCLLTDNAMDVVHAFQFDDGASNAAALRLRQAVGIRHGSPLLTGGPRRGAWGADAAAAAEPRQSSSTTPSLLLSPRMPPALPASASVRRSRHNSLRAEDFFSAAERAGGEAPAARVVGGASSSSIGSDDSDFASSSASDGEAEQPQPKAQPPQPPQEHGQEGPPQDERRPPSEGAPAAQELCGPAPQKRPGRLLPAGSGGLGQAAAALTRSLSEVDSQPSSKGVPPRGASLFSLRADLGTEQANSGRGGGDAPGGSPPRLGSAGGPFAPLSPPPPAVGAGGPSRRAGGAAFRRKSAPGDLPLEDDEAPDSPAAAGAASGEPQVDPADTAFGSPKSPRRRRSSVVSQRRRAHQQRRGRTSSVGSPAADGGPGAAGGVAGQEGGAATVDSFRLGSPRLSVAGTDGAATDTPLSPSSSTLTSPGRRSSAFYFRCVPVRSGAPAESRCLLALLTSKLALLLLTALFPPAAMPTPTWRTGRWRRSKTSSRHKSSPAAPSASPFSAPPASWTRPPSSTARWPPRGSCGGSGQSASTLRSW